MPIMFLSKWKNYQWNIQVRKYFFLQKIGKSETAPMTTMPTYSCNFQNIGVPQFGTQMKLIPFGDKFEVGRILHQDIGMMKFKH